MTRCAELPPELVAPVLALLPEPDVLDRLIGDDDARYFAALGAAGAPAGIEDTISRLYRGFWEELGLRQAAGELFVEAAALQRELPRLPDALGALGIPSGRIARSVFSGACAQALCILHAASDNRPLGC